MNHTSSGRVPFNKVYRYYIDSLYLDKKQSVSLGVRNQIREVFQQSTLRFKMYFCLSADILATLTNYTAISFGPEVKTAHYRDLDLCSFKSEIK